jgi:hypothetical protein
MDGRDQRMRYTTQEGWLGLGNGGEGFGFCLCWL